MPPPIERQGAGTFTEAAQMARTKYEDAKRGGASACKLFDLRAQLLELTDEAYNAQMQSDMNNIPDKQDEHLGEWPPPSVSSITTPPRQ